MKLQFRGDKILVEQARRARAALRVELLLGRFGDNVHSITLRLSKIDDAGGRASKRCEIAIGLNPKAVLVEHSDASLSVALERAADKAARAIARTMKRVRAGLASP